MTLINNSIIIFTMLIRNKTCEKCASNYDDRLDKCPSCGEKNENRNVKEGDKTTYLPIAKEIAYFSVGWLGFQIIGMLISLIAAMIWRDTSTNSAQAVQYTAFVNFLSYAIVFLILLLITYKDSISLLKTFKKWQPYVAAVGGFIAIYIFNIIYGTFLNIVYPGISDNTNETTVNSIVVVYPVLSVIIFGIVGPICEEFTYRVGLFSFLKRTKTWIAYLVTIIFFAIIHFDITGILTGDTSFINELANLPYYLSAAAVLTVLYHRFGFSSSVTCHILNNLISVLISVFTINIL